MQLLATIRGQRAKFQLRKPIMEVTYTCKTNFAHGIPLPPFVTEQRIDELLTLAVRPDDVFVVSYPKSGTTWTQQIVKLVRNGGKESGSSLMDAVPWLEGEGLELGSKGITVDDMPSPRSFKSHAPYHLMPGGPPHARPAKYIYVARNPKDVAVSFYYHVRGRSKVTGYSGPWDHFYRLFMEAKVAYGDWFDHILEWWKHRDDPNVFYLKFEDMKKDLQGAVKNISEFLEIELKPDIVDDIVEQASFVSMKSNDAANRSWHSSMRSATEAPFMRKGVVGDWKNHFTAEQNAEFDAVYAERMKGTGLDFDFY